MRKWMISLFSVLALAFAFTGCGGVEGNSSVVNSDGSGADVTSQITVPNSQEDPSSANNEYGISSELGTPPALPSS